MSTYLSSPLTTGTGYKLIKLGESAMHYAEEILVKLEIKPRYFNVLAAIAENPDFSQKELSTLLGIDPNIMVGIIDGLEKTELARRRRSTTDRRKYVLEITSTGQSLLEKGLQALKEGEEKYFATLSSHEKETLDKLCTQLLVAQSEH